VANNTEGNGYNVNTAWYSNMGAAYHITSGVDKLTMCEKYTRQEQIHIVNGGGMQITRIDKSTVYTPRNLDLKNGLYVPSS
jgi:hypothetical protein